MNEGAYSGLGRISDPVNGAYNPLFPDINKGALRIFANGAPPVNDSLSIASTDGVLPPASNWVTTANTFTTNIWSISYGNGLWFFGGGNRTVRTSTDLITWVTRTAAFPTAGFGFESTVNVINVAYGNGLFVAGSPGYLSGSFRASFNGSTWTTLPNFFTTLNTISYGNGLWMFAGRAGAMQTSTDLVTFTTQTSSFTTNINSVTYANGLWVAVGDGGTVGTSTDAVTWVTQDALFGTTGIQDVAYGNGLWVAVGSSGQIRTSTDAITWVTRDSGTTSSLLDVHYEGGTWVVVGASATIRVSNDGIAWAPKNGNLGTANVGDVMFGNGLWAIATGLQIRRAVNVPSFVSNASETFLNNLRLWESK